MRTQITASVFWKLFAASEKSSTEIPDVEHLRHRCLLGFTALDAALYTYWEASVLPDWKETLSLVSVALDSPSSPEILDELAGLGGQQLKKSQLVSTLRFLSNTGDAGRFTPNFVDFAAYLLLRDPRNAPIARELAELQSCRNACVHTGRPWSELQARRSLKLIEDCAVALARLGQNFGDAFDLREEENEALAA
jgi:hypothetical protein